MSIYETMMDGISGFITASTAGRCLEEALKAIDSDPSLKLMKGPPGMPGDTAHFWAQRADGTIVDGADDRVPDDYPYEGVEVEHESVREEIDETDGTVWHASPSDFDEFLFKEIGFHFAETKELAENAARLGGKNNAEARPYRINVSNMVEITGQKNGFSGDRLLVDLLERGHISEAQFNHGMDALENFEDNPEEMEEMVWNLTEGKGYYGPFDEYKQAEAEVLKKLFTEWGMDGFKYWNTFDAFGMASVFGEDFTKDLGGVQPDWSYIVLDDSQITPL